MTNLNQQEISKAEHDESLSAKRVVVLGGFNIPSYDEIALSHTGDDLTGVVYKKASVTVATLTLSHTDGDLTRIQRTT